MVPNPCNLINFNCYFHKRDENTISAVGFSFEIEAKFDALSVEI